MVASFRSRLKPLRREAGQAEAGQAALGATISVPTLGGPVELKIPTDSESGRKLRLRGRGLPGSGGAAAGDQIVELEILAPKAHSDAQRKAYAKMRDAFGDDWRRG